MEEPDVRAAVVLIRATLFDAGRRVLHPSDIACDGQSQALRRPSLCKGNRLDGDSKRNRHHQLEARSAVGPNLDMIASV